MAHLAKEQLRILYFNGDCDLILDEQVRMGTATEVTVHLRDVIKEAFLLNSSAILFAHNHPSGDPRPSREDALFTRKVSGICRELDITMLDHLIIGRADIFSFRDRGYM